MNKKGELCTATIIAIAVAVGSIVYLPFSIPKFRVRKGVEKCVEVEGISKEDCKEFIAGKSKDELLD